MNFKKTSACIVAASIAFANMLPVHAQDYTDEDYWYATCSQPQSSAEGVRACQGFRDYQDKKREQLVKDIDDYAKSIETLQSDTAKMEALAQKQKELANGLNEQIKAKEENIKEVESNIKDFQKKIDEKQKEIDVWDEQIKSRMQAEQKTLGTNMLIELIMGSKDFNDMLRRVRGIERITENDQGQIEQLDKLKKELEFKKEELVRLQDEIKKQKSHLEEERNQIKKLEESYRQLVDSYQKQIANLQAAKRAAQVNMSSIRDFVITQVPSGQTLEPAEGFSSPIYGGGISAGTWSYPGGGLHLGLDWAVPIGTPLHAPANGIIIYASNPVPSNSGYLGNWAGYPAGGGNTIQMICNVNGTLYAISFFHLSQEGMAVQAGHQVSSGQVIALTGNSGNTSGPHCHIEVINLGSMSLEAAVSKFSSNADFSWGTGWNSTATSCQATGGATPCRERPERFFS